LLVAACAAAAGCSSIDGASRRIASAVTPYKIEVVQGNFVSREQVERLQPGMSRQDVRDVLGTPLVASAFHADRWDYVFTMRRQGVDPQQRRLTVFFKGEVLDRVEGDPMPSENEFVAAIGKPQRTGKVPTLEATEEQLQKAAPARPAPAPQPAPPPAAASYPPLEPSAR
jgi:outer membrane protein assembly factor BamE